MRGAVRVRTRLPTVTGGDTVVDHIWALFPCGRTFAGTYRVHEQIFAGPCGGRRFQCAGPTSSFGHTGYADRELARAGSSTRDLADFEGSSLRSGPTTVLCSFNLGAIAVERHSWHEALGYLERTLAG